jgi:DNA-binding winged helix-turn-helix (wHTH) protein
VVENNKRQSKVILPHDGVDNILLRELFAAKRLNSAVTRRDLKQAISKELHNGHEVSNSFLNKAIVDLRTILNETGLGFEIETIRGYGFLIKRSDKS